MTDILARLKDAAWPDVDETRELIRDAIAEIERLRADVVLVRNVGPSFRELKHDIITTEFRK